MGSLERERVVAQGCSWQMENTRVWEPPLRWKKISSFCFLHSFFLLVFLNFPDPSHQKLFPWEHGNVAGSPVFPCIAGSPSPHNSLGIFCWGSPSPHNWLGIFCWGNSLKIQRKIKREVFRGKCVFLFLFFTVEIQQKELSIFFIPQNWKIKTTL